MSRRVDGADPQNNKALEIAWKSLRSRRSEQQFRPSDEFSTFKILKCVEDAVTTAITTLNSTEKEWVAVIPPILTVVSSFYVVEDDKKFIDRGGTIRFITDITYPYIELIQQHLDTGMEGTSF